PHPHFLVTAIKLGGDEPIFGIVFRNVGVEQKQIDSADCQLPDFGKHFAVQNSDGNKKTCAIALDLEDLQMGKILIETDRVLRPVLVDFLPKMAVPIKQADGDEV